MNHEDKNYGDQYFVFYKEETDHLRYGFDGGGKNVIAVDTRKAYEEIDLGRMNAGDHVFNAPYVSDWAITVEPGR